MDERKSIGLVGADQGHEGETWQTQGNDMGKDKVSHAQSFLLVDYMPVIVQPHVIFSKETNQSTNMQKNFTNSMHNSLNKCKEQPVSHFMYSLGQPSLILQAPDQSSQSPKPVDK